jgi:hypothetical protein
LEGADLGREAAVLVRSGSMSVALLMAALLANQDVKNPRPAKVDEARVEAAIQKGVAYLKSQADALGEFDGSAGKFPYDEIVLWTFIHAGVAETDPSFQKLLKAILQAKLERTYNVSVRAMVLEELDRVKYQGRIAQCAQFLVDNQCRTGQWSYGEPSPFVKDVPTGDAGKRDTPSGRNSMRRARRDAASPRW